MELAVNKSIRISSGTNVILVSATIIGAWWVLGHNAVWIYGFSYAYHALNLQAFLFRRSNPESFMVQAILFRTVAFILLGCLLVPYLVFGLNHLAVAVILIGTLLHISAFSALGFKKTYYGTELTRQKHRIVEAFPYDRLQHPMVLGSLLQFSGLYFLVPQFTQAYPFLVVGHLILSILTAVIEHFDLHFKDYFFTSIKGSFSASDRVETIDWIRDWSIKQFQDDLRAECSMHRYIKTLPGETCLKIDAIRYADEVMQPIRHAFPQSRIVPLPMTDEIYISRYNIDRGGDQGLFDRHHDGNLRFMPGASVVRSLLYLSSEDNLEIVFDTSGMKFNMKTYDFGLLDFHKELHWVNGSYDPEKPPRILLKCNYYVDHVGYAPYRWLGISLNVAVFYCVKVAMEYSKSPKTYLQKLVGSLCNIVRQLNNLNPAAPVALLFLLVVVSMKVILLQIGNNN